MLLALGLIFFPLVFDFTNPRPVDKTSVIPPNPDIQPVVIPEPVRPENIQPAKSDEEMFVARLPDPETETEQAGTPRKDVAADDATATLDADNLPVAWVVQIASFEEQDKANAMVQTLQQQSYKAFMQEANTQAGTTYRVMVGPNLRKQDSQQAKAAIDNALGTNAIIVRFKP